MISVVIPTYKNKDILIKNLKINLKFLEGTQIVIVNDNPEESLKKDLVSYPEVTLIENKKNSGFASSVNRGVEQTTGDFLLLLNSDTQLKDSSYKNAVNYFKNKELFAVSFAQIEHDGSLVGKNRIFWKQGMFHHSASFNLTSGTNAWAEGGACMIDRSKFMKLGGFDKLYSPFYWEDIDLSYRAQKRGWIINFDPSVRFIHHHESTIGKYFNRNYIKKIAFRNQFIFIWKNITDNGLLLNHFLLLLPNLMRILLSGEFTILSGLLSALKRLKKILKQRKHEKKFFIIPDDKILSKFNDKSSY